MVNHGKFTYRIGVAVLLILLAGGIARGAEQEGAEPPGAGSSFAPGPAEEKELPEAREPAAPATHPLIDAYVGYRFLSVNRYGGRAAEYDYLHSNPVLGGSANHLGTDIKFSLEGGYLSDRDYHGDLTCDYKGIYRVNLRTESLFHNLDHEPLFTPQFTLGGNIYRPDDPDPGERSGVRVEQDLARFRYKFPLFPLHLNLGYWRMVKEGSAQLRFADQAFGGTNVTNTIFSRTRGIDRQTHEGQFGVDAHLGLLDVIYDFRIREFGEHTATPRDNFIARPALDFNGGLLEHNENPDSRFYAHTIRLHTSMSGGVVGAASYTYGKRENLSNLTDFTGADQAYSIIHNVAVDLTYTPCRVLSLALKYRRQDVERNGPAALANPAGSFVNPPVSVRMALDTQKDAITATLSYRPTTLLTLKGEYKGEFLVRDNLGPWVQPGTISTLSYPAHSETHTGSLTLLSRPIKGLKLMADYTYSTTDSPAYANAYAEKHEGRARASYNAPNRWGVTAGTRISQESSNQVTIATIATLANPSVVYLMPRDKKVADATAGLWFVPLEKLTVTGSYSLLRSSTDQAVLFARATPGSNALTNYTGQAQVYAISGVYHCDERLDLALALQQVRSFAEFDPQPISSTLDTSGIKEISRMKTVESTLSARADYRFAKNLSCALEYAFRDYDEKNASLFNGSVNSVMLYLASKW
ncbi:MAG TPA: hypothetical protein VI298_00100 [Geobacteraceae bacterium]